MKHVVSLIILVMTEHFIMAQNPDPYLWLEEVESSKNLEWVETWNKKSLEVLTSQPGYDALYEKNLEILNSTDRIAQPSIRGDFVYNFWQDQDYQRGVWRRAKL